MAFFVLLTLFALPLVAFTHQTCKVINDESNILVRGVVNVIYLMNSSCDSCYFEAENLQSEMLAREVPINSVIAVNEKSEQVSTIVPGIPVDSGKLWTILGEHNSHVIVLDKCNRLAFEVIFPWSQFKLPFVKAAILSTQFSEPCGVCHKVSNLKENKEKPYQIEKQRAGIIEFPPLNSKMTSLKNTLISEEEIENKIPMRIIYNQPHMHRGDPNIYNTIEVLPGDPSYHHHPEDENALFFGTFERKEHNEEVDSESIEGQHLAKEESDGIRQVSDKEAVDKDKLWLHYFKILLWLPQV